MEQTKAGLEITGDAIDRNGQNVAATMLFYRWGELDPEEAMRHVRQLPGAYRYGDAILTAWIKNDPEAAYRWSLGEREFSQQLNIGRMLAGPLMSGPAASGVAKSIQMGPDVSQQYGWSLGMTMAGDPASRAEFLSAISQFGEKERNDGLAIMIRTWSRSSPEELLDMWGTLPIVAEERTKLLADVVGIWGRTDPAKAIGWAGANPMQAGGSGQTDIYRTWVSTDADAAGQWLAAQSDPAGIAADLVHQWYARGLQDTMGHIWWKEREQERESLRQHYRIWAEAKPQEAAQWLATVDPASAKSITEGKNESR